MITFTLEVITPSLAAQYLLRNLNNRTIVKERVLSLVRDIQSGAFMATHQCIAFNANGELIDGQHRLSAVVASEKTVQMYVARYDRTESAMALPLDTGLNRKHYDILDITKKQAELASAILRIECGAKTFTANEVQMCVDKHLKCITKVMQSTSATVKYRSSAGAKAAIVLLCERYKDDAEMIIEQYVKFVTVNLQGMWQSVAACMRSLENLRAQGGNGAQRMVAIRVWYAFKPENRDLKLIRIMDENAVVAEMQLLA